MRVLIWIVEETWKATVAAAAAFLPADVDIALLYVTAGEAQAVARGARRGLLGRPHHPSDESLNAISEQNARATCSPRPRGSSGAKPCAKSAGAALSVKWLRPP